MFANNFPSVFQQALPLNPVQTVRMSHKTSRYVRKLRDESPHEWVCLHQPSLEAARACLRCRNLQTLEKVNKRCLLTFFHDCFPDSVGVRETCDEESLDMLKGIGHYVHTD